MILRFKERGTGRKQETNLLMAPIVIWIMIKNSVFSPMQPFNKHTHSLLGLCSMHLIPEVQALRRQRQEAHQFHDSLGCISRPCLPKWQTKQDKQQWKKMDMISCFLLVLRHFSLLTELKELTLSQFWTAVTLIRVNQLKDQFSQFYNYWGLGNA